MATPPKGTRPAASKRASAPVEDAQPKDATGAKPTSENNKAKVVNKTASAPKGAPTNPPKPDVAKTHEYLDSVKPGEIKAEGERLAGMLKEAQASGDLQRASQVKDAMAGLKYKANAAGMPATDAGALADSGQLLDVISTVAGGVAGSLSRLGGLLRRAGNKPVTPAPPAASGQPRPANGTTGAYAVNRKGGPCIVGTYAQIHKRCGTGQQAHHIIPDTLARTSNRAGGVKGIGRIPGMPTFGGGPSICLQGEARTPGSEHNTAHQCDAEICAAGNRMDNGLPGTIPVSEAVPIAMKHAIAARPECKEQIEAEVRKAYPNHENDKRPMNSGGKPPEGETKAHIENGGRSSTGGRTRRR